MEKRQKFSLNRGLAMYLRNHITFRTIDDAPLKTIEAWKYVRHDPAKQYEPQELEVKDLEDGAVSSWLAYNDAPEHRSPHDIGEVQCCIRLIACNRLSKEYENASCSMSKESFLAVEKAFALPLNTLPVLSNGTGTFMSEFHFGGPNREQLVAMKIPQMMEIGSFGITMSHALETNTTLILLHGWNVCKRENDAWGPPIVTKFNKALTWSRHLWGHPLLLPIIMIQQNLTNIRNATNRRLSQEASNLEMVFGIGEGQWSGLDGGRTTTRSKMDNDDDGDDDDVLGMNTSTEEPQRLSYENLKKVLGSTDAERALFINRLNNSLSTAIRMRRAVQWNRNASTSLLVLLEDICELLGGKKTAKDWQIRNNIQNADATAAGLECVIDGTIATLQVQLEVLSNIIAQLDNSTNSKMAAEAGLEGVAMKTLALVTAFFLPPTFIATLFSMSMFDWQASSDDGGQTLSSSFWIYWVVTIPVTLIVLLFWHVWWQVSKYHYQAMFEPAADVNLPFSTSFKKWVDNMSKESKDKSVSEESLKLDKYSA